MLKTISALAIAVSASCPIAVASAAPAEAGSPAATVEALQTALIANMRSKDSCATRLKTLEPKLAAAFDFDFIAQKLVRRRWTDLDEGQRARLRTTVQHSAAVTYTTQFAAFNNERFELLDTTDSGKNGKRVTARLFTADGTPVAFDYAMRQSGGGWKIVNVVAQGVSDLALRSAQFESQIAREGFDGLLKNIELKDQESLASCGAPP